MTVYKSAPPGTEDLLCASQLANVEQIHGQAKEARLSAPHFMGPWQGPWRGSSNFIVLILYTFEEGHFIEV